MKIKKQKNKKLLNFVKALRKHELITEFCRYAGTEPSYLEQIYGGFRRPSPATSKNLIQAIQKLKSNHKNIELPLLELCDLRPDIWESKVA